MDRFNLDWKQCGEYWGADILGIANIVTDENSPEQCESFTITSAYCTLSDLSGFTAYPIVQMIQDAYTKGIVTQSTRKFS